MSNNPLFQELEKIISNPDFVGVDVGKVWNDTIASQFHKLKPSEVFKSDYFLNLNDTLYPFFFDLADQLHTERQSRKIDLVIFNMGIGSGKALKNGTCVLTPNGYTSIESLNIGDLVIGSDGKNKVVLGVFPQGKKKIWNLIFSDGSKIPCSEDHLWETTNFAHRNKKNYKDYGKAFVRNTKEIIDTLKTKGGVSNHSVKNVEPITFDNKVSTFVISHYLMGCLLGDGCFHNMVSFTNMDNDIIEKCGRQLHIDDAFHERKSETKARQFQICRKIRNNQMSTTLEEIIKLDLAYKKSHEKFIPKKYLFSSIKEREELLQGLMDTDGTVSKSGSISFTTTSQQLKNDFKFLVESLGGYVKICEKISKYKYKGVTKNGRLSYTITVCLPDQIQPFYTKRKQELYIVRTKYKDVRYIVGAEYIGEEDCTCISVDSNDNLFVTENAILTHNTYFSSALEYYEWLYYISTPNKKQAFPGIDPESTTAFILMSRDKDKAKKIVFTNVFRHFNCQFNKEYFPPNPRVKSYLDIPRAKTTIFPGTGEAVSALGFNIFSAIVDEAAFLQVASKGSSSEEVQDQAQAMYEQIHGRIESRFGRNGGMVIMISSANKEGNFIETMIDKGIKDGNKKHNIFWKRAPIWKTKPPQFYPSGEVFLFNKDTYEVITDIDMIREYMDARSRLELNSDFNPVLGGLLL